MKNCTESIEKNDSMETCLKEEQMFQFDKFNAEIALNIGVYGASYSKEQQLPITIEIYAFKKTLFHYSTDGCSANHEDWLRKKRNTVLYFNHSTKFLNIKNHGDVAVLESKYGLNIKEYCLTDGGFPITLKDNGVIGTICVSGLTPEEDHRTILHILDWYHTRYSAAV